MSWFQRQTGPGARSPLRGLGGIEPEGSDAERGVLSARPMSCLTAAPGSWSRGQTHVPCHRVHQNLAPPRDTLLSTGLSDIKQCPANRVSREAGSSQPVCVTDQEPGDSPETQQPSCNLHCGNPQKRTPSLGALSTLGTMTQGSRPR